MALKSLNFQIFRLTLMLLIFTSLGILVSVWTNTNQHAEKQLSQDLVIAENVFQQLMISREQQLFNSADILTSDFGFKQAVASNDKATIESVLQNHGGRIGADLMSVISLDNTIVASTTPALASGSQFPNLFLMNAVMEEGGVSSLMVFENKLYQVIIINVNAPTAIASTLLGFEMDKTLLRRLKNITQLETTISAYLPDDERSFYLSTLKEALEYDIEGVVQKDISWFGIYFLNESPLVSRRFYLPENHENNIRVAITLTEDMTAIFEDFFELQANISLVALVALILSLISAYFLSNNLSKPLKSFAMLASKISLGQYQQKLDSKIELKEVKKLSDAFETMQQNIQVREGKIIFQANHDLSTKLKNRFFIEQGLGKKLANKDKFQAIGVNVFAFRDINDVFGYQNGDACLRNIATKLKTLDGLAARLTGAEMLWLPQTPKTFDELIQIKTLLEEPLITDDVTIRPKVVFGILNCPEEAESLEQFFKRLNIVMDEAKLCDEKILNFDLRLEERYTRRLAIVTELKKALSIESNQFQLFYQPKLSLSENRVQHVEALIRWNNDLLGFVSPEEFISVAEQAGIINQVTNWVVNRAVIDAKTMREQGANVCIAINLSANDVMNKNLLPNILQLLAEHNVPKDALSFEITESDLVQDPEYAIAQMQLYRDEGFLLAIDDFGTGYSSLEYLKNLPVTSLKIDKSFVLHLANEQSDQSIVKTVIELAHQFNLTIIAEGIEDQISLELLQQWQCEYAQGYHISRPIPLSEFLKWFKKHQKHQWIALT